MIETSVVVAEREYCEIFAELQDEMIWQMSNLRSEKNGLYHDWADNNGQKSDTTVLPNIALGILSEIVSMNSGINSRKETIERLGTTYSSLQNLRKTEYHGFLPTLVDMDSARIADYDAKLSAVDNAYLFLANTVVSNLLPELRGISGDINSSMDFSFFLDPQIGLLHGVYQLGKNSFQEYHNGAICSDTRIADYIYMVQSSDYNHYFRLYRQIPIKFTDRDPHGSKYLCDQFINKPPIHMNGGNLLECHLPALFLDEEKIAPEFWGKQFNIMIDAEIEHGNVYSGGAWGHIPADYPNDKIKNYDYVVAGITELAANPTSVCPNILSPFACMMVAHYRPEEVYINLDRFKNNYPKIYRKGQGFFDSVDVRTGIVSNRVLADNVGMAILGLDRHLSGGTIQKITTEFFAPIIPTIASENYIN